MEIERKNEIKQFISLDNLLEILGNPTRRIILSKLAKVPHSASELSKILGISRQAVHTQLDKLSSDNVIEKILNETLEGGESTCKPGGGRGYGIEKIHTEKDDNYKLNHH